MNKRYFLLLTLLIPLFSIAQKKLKLELKAPSFINDSLLFAPSFIRKGFEELYNFKIDTNNNVSNFGVKFGIRSALFQLKIREENVINVQFDYPQPVSFQYFDFKENQPYLSSTFFLESGHYKIELPAKFNSYEVIINSPVNNEYAKFKKLFSDLYKKLDNGFDSLTDLTKKEQRIGSYIKAHADSYVALWEIVSDYTRHNYAPIYLENLQLFSDKIKRTALFREIERKFKAENATMIGNEFPDINFDKQNTLAKKDFKKYKLTFIDYWSTTCTPCIKAMPQMVAMYNEYKERGVNFITITDENEPKRIELANSILTRNYVSWTNYFDINKDFKNKVNATVYPLQFLIDQNGVIVTRVSGNLNEIKRVIDERLK